MLDLFIPFQFVGKIPKKPVPGSVDEACGIRIFRGTGRARMDLPNTMKVIIDNEVPPFIRIDFLWEDLPFLRMLKGIPLDYLKGGDGSIVAHQVFEQIQFMTKKIVGAGLFPTDLKPANAVVVEIMREDIEYWGEGHNLELGRRVFFIDGGQFVHINRRLGRMCGDGVTSLFREMHAFPEVRRAVTRDDVGRACIEEALSTLEGREPDATAKLNLGILVEAIMVGMAGTLRIKYKGDPTRLRARSPTLELRIGGEGLRSLVY